LTATLAHAAAPPTLDQEILPLFKARCVKCHGPAKREGRLNLATSRGLARGGKNGPALVAGQAEESLLWTRVNENEMPPKEPLAGDEKQLIRRWIDAGAPGLPRVAQGEPESADHWAFAPLRRPEVPEVRDAANVRTAVDRFIEARLELVGLSLSAEADRVTLVRRVAFDLTGLPPTAEEIAAFRDDHEPVAYERMVERYLASPRYGERWGKYWLDVAGYADSNGYFNADSDRPLAYRYRDYVVRSWNDDKPLDLFIREQLAGDELCGPRPPGPLSAEAIDRLVATHYLRNAPDGTGESDGNPDEVRADRYAVLEGATQIIGTSLLGLTLQCARCHDHKFEPVTQRDYYQLYAILWPAFDLERWAKPQQRMGEAPSPGELAAWEARARRIDAELETLRAEFTAWAREHRWKGTTQFEDDFDSAAPLAQRWSATAPGDDTPGGSSLHLDSPTAPGAVAREGRLRIVESGAEGNRWLSTRQAFDWTPHATDTWVQVTFDLVDSRIEPGQPAAERIGYYIALTDYNDNNPAPGGNILIDGNPAGAAGVFVDYPGADMEARGTIGSSGYAPRHSYGVRVTNVGKGKFRLEHLVDGIPEGGHLTLAARDLPNGGFGFEYCCGRSFIVDNVRIESGVAPKKASSNGILAADAIKKRRKDYDDAVQSKLAARGEKPGQIAWVTDLSASPSATHLLRRGLYHDAGPKVEPAPPSFLADPSNPFELRAPAGAAMTGRRTAFARWLTRADSRPAALVARVLANRIWLHHFGTGLAATAENLGYSGAPPSHPELLEFLAGELVRGGWRAKALHRLILNSAVYRQSSASTAEADRIDHDDRWLGRFPIRRLDAEAIRDAMLAAAGELDTRFGGPYAPTRHTDGGEGVIEANATGPLRRSIYLQQRRTQVVSLLDLFDAPSIVASCPRRNATATPLQSLSMLNSDFALARARGLAARLKHDAGTDRERRLNRAFVLTVGRPPAAAERAAALRFLDAQPGQYAKPADADEQAWADLCQMLFASNAFLYVD
jgi:hypothetical protein